MVVRWSWLICLTLIIVSFQNCSPIHMELEPLQLPSSGSLDDVSDADFEKAFAETLHPILKENCAACHGVVQVPQFADSNVEQSLATILKYNLVDFDNVDSSRFITQINSGHQGFSQALAGRFRTAINAWIDAITPTTPADPNDPGGGGGNPSPKDPPDSESPMVAITNPKPSTTHAGEIQLSASASDNKGVLAVQYFLNNDRWGDPVTTPPYSLALNTLGLTNGSYTLSAEAWDMAGNVGKSRSVSFTVNNMMVPDEPMVNPFANYTWISTNILVPKCVSCHRSGNAEDGVRYDSYTQTIRTVNAGNARGSKLFTITNSGAMPEGRGKLSSTELKAIEDWINLGAMNN